jgi:putative spermidine/putrescine transport system ATP-binding protein/spermidine/putrescine transport system ATP-binding protein
MESAEVRLHGLTKRFHGLTAVDDVSLTIEPGSMVALLGPSGCGKTTCLRMIAGLVAPTAGEVMVGGERITHVPVHKRNIGMLFQNYALFPHMTVAENIAFGLQMRGVGKAEAAEQVRHALELVRLNDFGGRAPSQLSGGQQQRVALARAIVIAPAVLLLDEPLGALDKALRENMQVELRSLQRRLGVTTILVTHDQDEALTMADQIVVMREGRLEQVGTAVDIYQRPDSRFVATFLGASNLFSGRIDRRNGRGALVTTPSGLRLAIEDSAADAGDVSVSVRPEAVIVSALDPAAAADDAVNTTFAVIDQIVYRGFITHYYLRLDDGQEMIAYQQNQTRTTSETHAQGDRVRLHWDASSNHVITRD